MATEGRPIHAKRGQSMTQYGSHSAPMPKFWFLGNPACELIQTKCKLSEI